MKKLALILLSLLALGRSYGQITYNNSIGLGMYACNLGVAPAINYTPRVNIMSVTKEGSVSLSIPFGLGYTPNGGALSNSLVLDIPIMADVNLGHASSPDGVSDIGEFFGIGYGFNLFGNTPSSNASHGLILNAGARMRIAEKSYGIRVSYMRNFMTGGSSIFGAGLFYTFGEF